MYYSFKKYLFLTGWLCICLNTNSQNSYLSFSHIGIEQGLSDMKVNTIVQDNLGFIWLGTDFGLNRYDGHNFFHYKNDSNNLHSLSSNIISSLYIDGEGNLWIGTNNGLNLYEYSSGKIYRFEKSAFANSQITVISSDQNQNLIVATTDKGLFIANIDYIIKNKKNDKKVQFKQLSKNDGLSNNYVRALHKDQTGNLWIGTSKGLNYYDSESESIKYKQIKDTILKFFENTKVTSISSSIINTHEVIWVGTSNGLYFFNNNDSIINTYFNEKSLSFNKKYITKVITQNDTTIWVGALGGGLKKINYLSQNIDIFDVTDDEQSIASSLITTLFIDNNELIWVGAGGSGLDVANTGKNIFTNYLFHNYSYGKKLMASSFVEDQDKNLLITTYNGIIKFNKRLDQLSDYVKFPWVNQGEKPVSSNKILQDKRGNLWIATFGKGLFLYDKNLKFIKNYKNNVNVKNSLSNNYIYSIHLDTEGHLYIGTRNGMNVLDPKTDTFKAYYSEQGNPKALTNPYITAITESENGAIWIGSWGGGIYKFNKKTKNFEHFKFDENESNQSINNSISQILPVGDSILWLATNNGVKKYNINTQQTRNYTIENGLQSRNTNGLILKNKQLWINAGSGISVLNTENEKIINFKKSGNLFIGDLIRQSELLHSNGDIYFGGYDGFVKINPENMVQGKKIYKTYISDFFIFSKSINNKKGTNRPVFVMDTISISTADKVIRFELTTLNYQNQENVRYKYKLTGLNDEFIELSKAEHTIGFTNLEYGNYQLFIKTTKPDATWGQTQKVVTLIVKPRIWQTTGFKILGVLFVIILVYTIYRRRLVNIRRQNEKLELLVKQKTHELENSMNALFQQKEKLSETNIKLEETQEEITEQAEELIIISEKLRESNITLEKKVESRTKDLNSALLKADDARRLISAFLENMSHEIRTPMNAISGFSQLIAEHKLPAEKVTKYADIILQNVDSLLDLINNIMDASKLHAGQYIFKKSTFVVNDLFKLVYEKLVHEKKFKKEYVECKLILPATDQFLLYSDSNALTQVIYNLAENALKYTEKGSVEFGYMLKSNKREISEKFINSQYKINAKKKDLELEIFVKDTGSGINEKEQEIIFDLFRKLESSKEKLYRGSGLGLAIVNNLSVKLHAKITLKSKINSGTYISLTIPLSEIK